MTNKDLIKFTGGILFVFSIFFVWGFWLQKEIKQNDIEKLQEIEECFSKTTDYKWCYKLIHNI